MIEYKVATLLSGRGSNAENLIKTLHNKEVDGIKISFALALSNKADAEGIKKTKNLGIESVVLDHKEFKTREDFDSSLVSILKSYEIELVLLAGFMRILTPVFTDSVKALNIHPSLLPLFKGDNAMRMSYECDMKVAGVSVHEVTNELDSGKIVAQDVIEKRDGESFPEFKERMHALEYRLYPEAALKYISKTKISTT